MRNLLLSIIVAFSVLAVVPAYSNGDKRAAISQSQAIKIAKKHQTGKVVSIKLITNQQPHYYKIRILQTVDDKQRIKSVLVDAKSGKVLSGAEKE